MKCQSCNNEIREGASFCAVCGAPVSASGSVSDSAPAPSLAPTKRLGKLAYISKLGSKKSKILSIIVIVTAIIAILASALSLNNMFNSSLMEIPVVEAFLPQDASEEFEDELDDLREIVDRAEETFNENKSELDKKTRTLVADTLDSLKEFTKTPSLSSLNEIIASYEVLANKVEELSEADLDSDFDIDSFPSEFLEATKILDIVNAVFITIVVIAALFMILAAIFKSFGYVIPAMILSLPICLLAGGSALTLLMLAASIATIVLCAIISSEYKAYKRSF